MKRAELPLRTSSRSQQRRPRRGLLTFELVMTLPVLGLVLMGLFEFSLLFFARGELVEAARLGARKAALPGATQEDIEDEIRRSLSPRMQNTLEVAVTPATHSGEVVSVELWTEMKSGAPDLLWPIGLSLDGQHLYAVAHMVRE